MPDVTRDGLDEMDVYADEFERLGRAAGAELRAMPPSGGDRAVVRSADRRRSVITFTSVIAALSVVLVGLGWMVRSDDEPPVPSALPLVPVDPGWIVYEVGGGGRQVLRLVRPDGSDVRPLIPEFGDRYQSKPDWSPDGTRVVFTMRDSGGDELWTVDVDGSDPTLLLGCTDDCESLDEPSWSPDGTQVAYARFTRRGEDLVGSLELVDVSTSKVQVLLEGASHDLFAAPRWAPNGRSLVVEVAHRSDPTVNAEVTGVTLTVVELDVGTPRTRPLTDAGTFAMTPDWSPGGDLIVYAAPASSTASENDLFIISPAGGRPERLTFLADSGGYAAFPSFDHSGDRVIFSAARANNVPVLAVVDVDGGEFTTIGERTIAASRPRP
jgi:Tol biopolymer transport system component